LNIALFNDFCALGYRDNRICDCRSIRSVSCCSYYHRVIYDIIFCHYYNFAFVEGVGAFPNEKLMVVLERSTLSLMGFDLSRTIDNSVVLSEIFKRIMSCFVSSDLNALEASRSLINQYSLVLEFAVQQSPFFTIYNADIQPFCDKSMISDEMSNFLKDFNLQVDEYYGSVDSTHIRFHWDRFSMELRLNMFLQYSLGVEASSERGDGFAIFDTEEDNVFELQSECRGDSLLLNFDGLGDLSRVSDISGLYQKFDQLESKGIDWSVMKIFLLYRTIGTNVGKLGLELVGLNLSEKDWALPLEVYIENRFREDDGFAIVRGDFSKRFRFVYSDESDVNVCLFLKDVFSGVKHSLSTFYIYFPNINVRDFIRDFSVSCGTVIWLDKNGFFEVRSYATVRAIFVLSRRYGGAISSKIYLYMVAVYLYQIGVFERGSFSNVYDMNFRFGKNFPSIVFRALDYLRDRCCLVSKFSGVLEPCDFVCCDNVGKYYYTHLYFDYLNYQNFIVESCSVRNILGLKVDDSPCSIEYFGSFRVYDFRDIIVQCRDIVNLFFVLIASKHKYLLDCFRLSMFYRCSRNDLFLLSSAKQYDMANEKESSLQDLCLLVFQNCDLKDNVRIKMFLTICGESTLTGIFRQLGW